MGGVIESPCNDDCSIDPATGLCRGCMRTADEIANWLSYTKEERRRIMGGLSKRATNGAMGETGRPCGSSK